MAKYQITTDQGTYEVETDEAQAGGVATAQEPTASTKAPFNLGREVLAAAVNTPGIYARSAGRLAGGVGEVLMNPYPSAIAAYDAAMKPLDAIKGYVKGRYDSPQAAMKTLTSDPFGVIADASGLMGGAGALTGAKGLIAAANIPGQALGKMAAPIAKPLAAGANRIDDMMNGVSKDYTPVIAKNAEEFRKIINPGKSEIKTFETIGKKKIDDTFELAAKEKLIINKTSDGKLDTSLARESVSPKIDVYEDQLQKLLASSDEKKFNIDSIVKKATPKLREQFANDKQYLEAIKELKDEAAAIKKTRGNSVTASEANVIKRGMYKVAYNDSRPTSHTVARVVGRVLKEEIEAAYPDGIVGIVNQRLGKYLDLDNVLEKAHGRVVSRGKIGKYGAEVTGALAGSTLTNIPIVGPIAGKIAGGKISEFFNDPERLTKGMAKRLKGFENPELDLPLSEYRTPSNVPPPTGPQRPLQLTKQSAITRADRLLQQSNEGYSGPVITPEGKAPLGLPKPPKQILRSDRLLPNRSNVSYSGPVITPEGKAPLGLPKPPKQILRSDRLLPNRSSVSYSGPVINAGYDINILSTPVPKLAPSNPITDLGNKIRDQILEKYNIPLHPSKEVSAAIKKLYGK